MAQNDIILQELLELKSGLAGISRENVFQAPANYFNGLADEIIKKVRTLETASSGEELTALSPLSGNTSKQTPYSAPAGYFDNLAEKILNRVRALEFVNAADELASLSPLLSTISKQVPYTVPAGYFDALEKRREQTIITNKDETAAEELESISPLLGGLKKQTPYTLPEGYFANLQNTIIREKTAPVVKVISITRRKWFRYAAAALVVGFVATIGLLLLNKPERIDPSDKSFAWVQKNMKKVSTDDINEFVELASAGNPETVKIDAKDEINSLLKDVSDKEIQDFLNETQPAESEADDDLIMN